MVEKTAVHFKMFRSGDKVLVGLSGGADSVALLHILFSLKNKFSIKVGAVHLNHCLRGQESERDEQFAMDMAEKLDVPFYHGKIDVKKFCKKNKLSLEDAARQVRYDFFEKIAKKNGYSKIAVGHHADDNAELILMNILRGSGPSGLSGILPVRNLKIVRPLIELTRVKILEFLDLKNILYITDSSNNDQTFLRNRVRLSLIPFLKESFNPSIVETLNRTGAIIRSENQWFSDEVTPIFEEVVIKRDEKKIKLSIIALKKVHPAAVRRIIRMAIKAIKGDLKRISQGHVDNIIEQVEKGSHGKNLDLPDRIQAKINYGYLIIVKQDRSLRELGLTKK